MTRSRTCRGQYTDEPGTASRHSAAAGYARAIRIAMASQGLQVGALARRMGFSRVHVSRALAGEKAPSARFLAMACAALRCDRAMLDVLARVEPTDDPLACYLRGELVA